MSGRRWLRFGAAMLLSAAAMAGEASAAPRPRYTRDAAAAEIDALRGRVVDLHRQLYRVTPEPDRPKLLAGLMADPLEPSRQLAIDLTLQRLTDAQPVDADLRAALVARLDDDSALIRQSAARVLRELADGPGAEAVARRLADGTEREPEVIRAYLLVLSRVARSEAIEPAIAWLADPSIRGEAAGALSRAAGEGLLSETQKRDIASKIRVYVRLDRPPEPRVIELIGHTAQHDDWPRIEAWMGDGDAGVRSAAAWAWSRAGQRLDVLARYADDPSVLPALIFAIERRAEVDLDAGREQLALVRELLGSGVSPDTAAQLSDLDRRLNPPATAPAATAPATQTAD